ncbi:helix-turn-helix domain-containing protein [Sphingomonas sp. Marseille-Q8236]
MRDMDPEDIKAAVRKRGVTLTELARRNGLQSAALRLALTLPRAQAESVIASFLDVHPMEIWPSRYSRNGQRLRPQPVDNYAPKSRFGKPVQMYHHEANGDRA